MFLPLRKLWRLFKAGRSNLKSWNKRKPVGNNEKGPELKSLKDLRNNVSQNTSRKQSQTHEVEERKCKEQDYLEA